MSFRFASGSAIVSASIVAYVHEVPIIPQPSITPSPTSPLQDLVTTGRLVLIDGTPVTQATTIQMQRFPMNSHGPSLRVRAS